MPNNAGSRPAPSNVTMYLGAKGWYFYKGLIVPAFFSNF